MVSLEDSWKEATEGFDVTVSDTWFNRLQEVYSEEKRTYHNLDMLREKLNHYYDIKDNLKSPQAMLLAIMSINNFLNSVKKNCFRLLQSIFSSRTNIFLLRFV